MVSVCVCYLELPCRIRSAEAHGGRHGDRLWIGLSPCEGQGTIFKSLTHVRRGDLRCGWQPLVIAVSWLHTRTVLLVGLLRCLLFYSAASISLLHTCCLLLGLMPFTFCLLFRVLACTDGCTFTKNFLSSSEQTGITQDSRVDVLHMAMPRSYHTHN